MFTEKQTKDISFKLQLKADANLIKDFGNIATDTVALVKVYLYCKRWIAFFQTSDNKIRDKIKKATLINDSEMSLLLENISGNGFGMRADRANLITLVEKKREYMLELINGFSRVTRVFDAEDESDLENAFVGLKG